MPEADGALDWSPEEGWSLAPDTPLARQPEALACFELFKPLLDIGTGDRLCVIAQLGQSLDGCIATASGESCYVTGPESALHLHRLRALSDAVLVGPGTVATDNPQLTTRHVPGAHPLRVVLDPHLVLPAGSRVFTDGVAPTLRLHDASVAPVMPAGHERLRAVPGLLDPARAPAAILAALRAEGIRVLFVEGGGVTVSRFLTAGLLDRLHLIVAPLLLGAGRPGLRLPAVTQLADAPRPPARPFRLGDDILWELDLASGHGATPATADAVPIHRLDGSTP